MVDGGAGSYFVTQSSLVPYDDTDEIKLSGNGIVIPSRMYERLFHTKLTATEYIEGEIWEDSHTIKNIRSIWEIQLKLPLPIKNTEILLWPIVSL